jgi:hypothetical protein
LRAYSWRLVDTSYFLANLRLAAPVRQYPSLFGDSQFFARYAYVLPNLITAVMLLFSSIFGILFLKETHDRLKYEPSMGQKTMRFFRQFFRQFFSQIKGKVSHISRKSSKPNLTSSDASYNLLPVNASENLDEETELESLDPSPTQKQVQNVRPSLKDTFTRQIIINMMVWAGFSLQNNTFGQLFPVLCSTKVSESGLGMKPGQIGVALSIAGIMAVVFQMTIFPWTYNRLGGLACLRIVLGLYPILLFVSHLFEVANLRVSRFSISYLQRTNLITLL